MKAIERRILALEERRRLPSGIKSIEEMNEAELEAFLDQTEGMSDTEIRLLLPDLESEN